MFSKIALAVMSVLAVVFFAWLLVEKSRNTDLNSRLDQQKLTLTSTESDLAETRRKSTQTDRDLIQAKRSIEQLEREKNNLAAEAQRTQRSLDSARNRLTSAEDDLAALDKIKSETGTVRASLSAAEKRLEELEPLEAEVTRLRQALAEAESRTAAVRQSSEWAIRDEEVEKLVGGPQPETEATPAASAPDDQAARIRELEARLAECQADNSRPDSEAESGSEPPNETAPVPPAGDSNERDEKLSQAEDRLKQAETEARAKIQAAEAEAANCRQQLEAAMAAARDTEKALESLRGQLMEMTQERDRLLAEENETRASARVAADNYGRLVKDLQSQLENREAAISNLKDEMSLTFLDSVFFAPGRDAITDDGARALDRLAGSLKGLRYHRLMVVGHADDQPIVKNHQKVFATNWELSSARAVAVTRYLTEKGGLPPEGLTAAGRSCFDPAAPNDSDEHRRRNRRVEIIISSAPLPVRPADLLLRP